VIVSINQPAYLAWLGYYHRIAASDLHIELDHVQFEKNSFTNRNKVRTTTGWCWLTVPVRTRGRFGALALDQVEIAEDGRWAAKHWRTIEQNYRAAPFFAAHRAAIEAVYARPWARLVDLIRALDDYVLGAFGIQTPRRRSSELGVEGRKDDLVVALCRKVGATTYISGPLGRNYLDEAKFAACGIAVRYHDYVHPVYAQVQGGFEPAMAAIDLLLNHGPAARGILAAGCAKP
jgi:hypothetical protein